MSTCVHLSVICWSVFHITVQSHDNDDAVDRHGVLCVGGMGMNCHMGLSVPRSSGGGGGRSPVDDVLL